MIKRRSIRIKAVQAAYSFEHSDNVPLEKITRNLRERIQSFRDIYFYNLYCMVRFMDLLEEEASTRAVKHLKTEEDRDFNTKLLSNTFLNLLAGDEVFQRVSERLKFAEQIDEALLKRWYKKLTASEAYAQYLRSDHEFDPAEDAEIIRYLYKDVLLEDEDFHAHLNDLYSNWIDDAGYVSFSVLQTIDKSTGKLSLITEKASYRNKMNEMVEFGIELLEHTVRGKDKHLEYIESRLKNWDIERLASTDVIILRMALAELINFPTIPVKVTINEYIDIAKEYSTPKSKDFVNGILDNLSRQLTEKGIIEKTGRGLKES